MAAPKAIQLHDDEFITGPDELQDGGKLIAPLTALAARLLGTGDLTTYCPEAGFLGGMVLVKGRNARNRCGTRG